MQQIHAALQHWWQQQVMADAMAAMNVHLKEKLLDFMYYAQAYKLALKQASR